MYLFLFQAPKHANSYAYYRFKKANTRGEFDLRSLRKATKDKVKIWGHGTHPIFKVLADHGLSKCLNGHLLEVEDPKAAVWVKLNYDLLGKNGIKYVGGFKDLDLETIREMSVKISTLSLEQRHLQQHNYPMSTLLSSVDRLVGNFGGDNTHPFVSKETAQACRELRVHLGNDIAIRNKEQNTLNLEISNLRSKLEKYVKGCGMDPGAR